MQEWVEVGGISKLAATFNYVGWLFNLFMATTGDVWIIPSFRNWGYMLHVLKKYFLKSWPEIDDHIVAMCPLCYAGVGGGWGHF